MASVTVRLVLDHLPSYNDFHCYGIDTITHDSPMVALAGAYRIGRNVMGRRDGAPWWTVPNPFGWSLETLDATGYRVDLIVVPEQWDPAGHRRSVARRFGLVATSRSC